MVAVFTISEGAWKSRTVPISDNHADKRGGGIFNSGEAFIAYSTITDNEAAGSVSDPVDLIRVPGGGGIYNDCPTTLPEEQCPQGAAPDPNNTSPFFDPGIPGALFDAALVFGNTAVFRRGDIVRTEISSSILAGNGQTNAATVRSPSPDCFSFNPSIFRTFGGNVFGEDRNCTIAATTFSSTFPDTRTDTLQIAALREHGGPTATHALLAGSVAIGRGVPHTSPTEPEFFDCPQTDQRGFRRPTTGEGCDSGAYQFGAAGVVNKLIVLGTPQTSLDRTPAANAPGGTYTVTASFTPMMDPNVIVRDPIFQVFALSGGNVLLNADGGPAQVTPNSTPTLTPNVGPDRIVRSTDSLPPVNFLIGLTNLEPFRFQVNILGTPEALQ